MNTLLSTSAINVIMTSVSHLSGIASPLFVNRKLVERRPNVSYGKLETQLLDVYLPKNRAAGAKLPMALFLHGGGFRFFSKDSHASAAARLAETGRIVFCADYRLAPEHPYPAGLSDAAVAYSWMIENADRFGGDPSRVSLIGESAGGGLALSLCLYFSGMENLPASASLPPMPTHKPKAAIPHCGYFEVSNIDRFLNDPRFHKLAGIRVGQIRDTYVPDYKTMSAKDRALADPIIPLETLARNSGRLPKDFPEIFIPVGERDPVIVDSKRLGITLASLGQADRLKIYPGVGHAFYAIPSTTQAKICWMDIAAFLDRSQA